MSKDNIKKVAKLVMVDKADNYLLLELNKHPRFGNDGDLPGGTVDGDESTLEAMLREVWEEIGVRVEAKAVSELYSGAEYSKNNTFYALYLARFEERPKINLSWEHVSYEWLPRKEFLEKAKKARDTYMHMVNDMVAKL